MGLLDSYTAPILYYRRPFEPSNLKGAERGERGEWGKRGERGWRGGEREGEGK